jgi:hypothetical protein
MGTTRSYLEYPRVLAVVPVDIVSCLWAQAPKVKVLAKTARIMIAFRNFNLYRLLSEQVATAF